MTDTEPRSALAQPTTDSEQVSRLKRYDKRVEEWLGSLKDEAEQRSPEVLSALAAKAKDVADYLDKMAEKSRSRGEATNSAQALPTSDSSSDPEPPVQSRPSGGTEGPGAV